MRLAIVETAPKGGLLHYAVQLGDALAERGHEVDLITPRDNELAARTGAAHMRAVLTPPVRDMSQPRSRAAYQARRLAIALRLARAWARVLRESNRGRYDAEIVNCDVTLSPVALAVLALTLRPRRPRIAFVCHNVRPFNRWAGGELFETSRLLTALLRRLYARLDLVFVHGERSREEFESLWPPTRLATIPHGDEGIFAAEPPPPSAEERILFFGDWRKVKGLDVLTEAFDQLARRRPTVKLTIAGTPSPVDLDPERVRQWARGHGDGVEVIDQYVPVEDVPAVFGRARVVATPYLVGYQSGVAHLAMTMARAVVASDVGDLPSAVIDGVTGRVVPAGDAAALARALEELVSDPDAAQRAGEEGRRRLLRSSSWSDVAERVDAELAPLTVAAQAGRAERR
jgi:glycosyltransferase involved in cell wall biosynthesis